MRIVNVCNENEAIEHTFLSKQSYLIWMKDTGMVYNFMHVNIKEFRVLFFGTTELVGLVQ